MTTENLAVCLVSGGMDSCVTAAIARAENSETAFLHVSYGQRTEARERRAFDEIADFFGVKERLSVSIEYLAKIGGSSLTDARLEVSEANLESKEIPTSYVPFRNANMLAIATSWAEVLGANRIYIGAVAEDSSGYPDCRPEFSILSSERSPPEPNRAQASKFARRSFICRKPRSLKKASN
jgi:7-cyano-7-deazaguanine synthase